MNSHHLHLMDALVTVSEHGTIGETVRNTDRRKSELNTMIQLLEKETGLILLDRHAEQNAVTEAGWEIVEETKHLFKRREERGEPFSELQKPLYMVIAHCPTAEVPGPEGFYRQLVRRFPYVEIKFVEDDPEIIVDMVKSADADFGMVPTNSTDYSSLSNLQLDASPLGCYCRKDNPLAKLDRVTLTDLITERQILPISRYGQQQLADLAPHHTWECSSLFAAQRLVDQGQGWLLTERSLAEDRVICGKWVELPLDPEVYLEANDLALLWNENTVEPQLKQVILDLLNNPEKMVWQ